MIDEPENSRQKEVNSEIGNQVAPDGKDDVVDGKEEGIASQTYDSLRMLTKVDVLQMKFNSEEDAYSFYNAYAKVIGFSVQRSRKQICGDNKFVERKHNHPLAAPHCVPFLWSHRFVTSADQAQAKAMRNVGTRTSQIMDFMVHQSGEYEKVGFIHRDLHNQFQAKHKVQFAEGDAEDGRSRMDYAAFGDVLVFDTTYRTNQYKKPFVILAGVSNHFMTIIFGCALFPNETMETYTWVLETLMEAMDGQRPISIVTDGDRAMRQAIERVIPNCRHCLCSWHLEKNASTNVHIPEFTNDFAQLMLKKCKIVEFDNAWARMVKQYKLENNNWVFEIHCKRDKWVEAYLRGHMFAGMKSTQRVEGMNAYFNMFLEQKVRLYKFVAQHDRALARMRVNEAETESKTENSFPVLTTPLRSLEKHAAELFTRKIFSLFRREISKKGKLFVMERVELEDRCTYHFGEYKAPTCTWTVKYFPADITIKCCCLKFESFGIPCCHMVTVMKFEQLMCIPPSCVLKRWTRRGRSGYQQPNLTQISSTLTQTARFGILSLCFSEMSYYASHADNNFEEAREMAFQMTLKMKKCWAMRTEYNTKVGDKNIAPKLCGVGDPNVVKTKGNPGGTSSMGKPPKPRRCGYCRSIGHTNRRCKKLASTSLREGSDSNIETFMNTELEPHMEDINEPTNSQV
ncbi:hypothetical protein ACSBR1_007399 [Camellia fascicularis]